MSRRLNQEAINVFGRLQKMDSITSFNRRESPNSKERGHQAKFDHLFLENPIKMKTIRWGVHLLGPANLNPGRNFIFKMLAKKTDVKLLFNLSTKALMLSLVQKI